MTVWHVLPSGHRRGLVRELADAIALGAVAVREFARRHSDVSPETGCWLWSGPTSAGGYGYMVDPREPITRRSMPRKGVHRIVCEIVHRPMLETEQARHLCHTPRCVNPDHLLPGSRSENMNDSVRDGRWKFTSGTGNGRAKVTETAVAELRRDFQRNRPGETRKWAERLGITEGMVRQIVRGVAWPHVKAAT